MNPDWREELFNLALLDFLRAKGFSKVNKHAFELLKEIFRQKTKELMVKLKSFSELNQRTEANVFDVLHVLESNGIEPSSLTSYIQGTQSKFQNSEKVVSRKLIRYSQGIHKRR